MVITDPPYGITGIELSPEYYAIAQRRIDEALL
jgi:DNA modification methylase